MQRRKGGVALTVIVSILLAVGCRKGPPPCDHAAEIEALRMHVEELRDELSEAYAGRPAKKGVVR